MAGAITWPRGAIYRPTFLEAELVFVKTNTEVRQDIFSALLDEKSV